MVPCSWQNRRRAGPLLLAADKLGDGFLVDADGTSFGRYRLTELLGRGGMGEVWRAYDTVTDRVVALKLLPRHLADDAVFKARFRREAHAAAQLTEPHVVPIHTYGEIDGRLFVDMRLIEGRDLQAVLAAGPLEPARAVAIVTQVAEALHAAHRVGLVHRDVKPSNILITEQGFAYLIDFGIARSAGEAGLTTTGGWIGTLSYMAPERFSSGRADARSDIYALAGVLYQAMTGSIPFPLESPEQQMASHLTAPPPRPSDSRPDVPASMDSVIAKGMAKNPDDRYATTLELAEAARDATTAPMSGPTLPWRSEGDATRTTAEPRLAAQPPIDSPQPQQPPAYDFEYPMTPPNTSPYPPEAQRLSPRRSWKAPLARSPNRVVGHRTALVLSVLAITVAVAAAVVILVTSKQNHPSATGPQTQRPAPETQVVLPFRGLTVAGGVAVDSTGTVYVTDEKNARVLKLPAGSTAQSVLPFTGLSYPMGIAVDRAGATYVTDGKAGKVLKLAAGSTAQTQLPFIGLEQPTDIAVDGAGTVYVVDHHWDPDRDSLRPITSRIVKLTAGSTAQAVLPFNDLRDATGVAVDGNGATYVADFTNTRVGDQNIDRVVKLAAGSTAQTVLPFSGLDMPTGVAVDTRGAVYVSDNRNLRVLKLVPGSTDQSVLAFDGLKSPTAIAVDDAGAVYVFDTASDQVLKLPQTS